MRNSGIRVILLFCISSGILFSSPNLIAADWLKIIRSIPYSYSNGFHSNLSNIRQWVLLQNGFCEVPERHILFNYRGNFLGYIENQPEKKLTQNKLNDTRQSLQQKGKVNRWIEGRKNQTGYPFALNCNQPHADIYAAMKRLFGHDKKDRLWGTWDGMRIGTEKSPVPLYQLVEEVYKKKSSIIKQPVKASEYRHFLAQIIIESGARKNGLSKANAIGLLQLKPSVLKDCQIPQKHYRHRMAQVDCAVRLFQQNRRNLKPVFDQKFGHLPADKQQTIFSLLLVQSYHSGVGRISQLLLDPNFNQAANHFAAEHNKYSAEDIATGLIYHNLGRKKLGFASLYYVIDIAITAQKLCTQKQLSNSWVCV
ncbi:hypothetical protein [Aliikangiella coralliicola]|uniref:Transglycosylase SLT domain-containing protein n=1 Tax=Aliikangiella coralliicola TaxID=2592383 RepID=A0A545U8Q6_9GAMM|nr:hypothetical protein [Aliikangiella coralliicola]TQV85851.1 hypothetical protein FLL46_18165 [Aliikangiella coralliicola]